MSAGRDAMLAPINYSGIMTGVNKDRRHAMIDHEYVASEPRRGLEYTRRPRLYLRATPSIHALLRPKADIGWL